MLLAVCRCPRGADKCLSCMRICRPHGRRRWRGHRTSCCGTQTPHLCS
uniref:Uncharacterized protein n=1 Tax=Arundo donax TaxID=35708 RepID=A0A0A9EG94_ARUDO